MGSEQENTHTSTSWLDGAGRGNLIILLFWIPWVLWKKRFLSPCDPSYSLMLLNRLALILLAVIWVSCVVWEWAKGSKELTAVGPRKRMVVAAMRMAWNLPGLLFAIALLAEGAWQYAYAGLLALVVIALLFASRVQVRKVLSRRAIGLSRKARSAWLAGSLAIGWFGLMVWLVSPRQIGEIECATVRSVKANMHDFQTMVELYRLDTQAYPASSERLYQAARQKGYAKPLPNPFFEQTGYGKSYLDFVAYHWPASAEQTQPWRIESLGGIRLGLTLFKPAQPVLGGLVLYEYRSPSSYRVYGTDIQGELIQDGGQIYMLHPSR